MEAEKKKGYQVRGFTARYDEVQSRVFFLRELAIEDFRYTYPRFKGIVHLWEIEMTKDEEFKVWVSGPRTEHKILQSFISA